MTQSDRVDIVLTKTEAPPASPITSEHLMRRVQLPTMVPAWDEPRVFTIDDEIPMEFFGKDHWSTLAYIETKIVDFGFRIQSDPRMRTNLRRNHRIATHGGRTGIRHHITDGGGYPTRLSNGTDVAGHDDWECMVDLIRVGVLKTRGEPGLGKLVKLTPFGSRVVSALRTHKANGGTFATFRFNDEVAAAPAREGEE
jgi:hypothetical protein